MTFSGRNRSAVVCPVSVAGPVVVMGESVSCNEIQHWSAWYVHSQRQYSAHLTSIHVTNTTEYWAHYLLSLSRASIIIIIIITITIIIIFTSACHLRVLATLQQIASC
jgi:hypothetical protein